jgi:hypothetical protein
MLSTRSASDVNQSRRRSLGEVQTSRGSRFAGRTQCIEPLAYPHEEEETTPHGKRLPCTRPRCCARRLHVKLQCKHQAQLFARLVLRAWREEANRSQRARAAARRCLEGAARSDAAAALRRWAAFRPAAHGHTTPPSSPPANVNRSSYSPFRTEGLWSAGTVGPSSSPGEAYVPFVEEANRSPCSDELECEPLWLRNACALVLKQCRGRPSAASVQESVLCSIVQAASQPDQHLQRARRWALENAVLLRHEAAQAVMRAWLRHWHEARLES